MSIQEVLTVGYEFVLFGSIVWFGVLFVDDLVNRQSETEVIESEPELTETSFVIVPQVRKFPKLVYSGEVHEVVSIAPKPVLMLCAGLDVDYDSMSPDALRKACQSHGIKWRSAHGKNKHLKAAEMRQMLKAIAA